MKHTVTSVPYGYEPPKEEYRGTLIYYDTFEDIADEALDNAEKTAEERNFSKFVLYPLHEETVRRMQKHPVRSYYKREQQLESWKQDRGSAAIIESFEAKRKKYTPMDTALRHLTDKFPAPHLLYLTADMANLFASYSSFAEWIVKLRLILADKPDRLHPLLEKHRSRWDVAGEEKKDA
ncbi:hypothetical protein GRF59_11375 [Paenibacillus sp. HJL G12]|uniref:Uncharacterized protein n=1 Tax=Paenibacillus dendrobii TaxID=2691084 RepID=A0A7X3IIP0_9BACL|nr:hypothetical protein [Paenibacillus dendrobii]MWV44233.1 hypothetical protein [Paenibacillus dendrobii]